MCTTTQSEAIRALKLCARLSDLGTTWD